MDITLFGNSKLDRLEQYANADEPIFTSFSGRLMDSNS